MTDDEVLVGFEYVQKIANSLGIDATRFNQDFGYFLESEEKRKFSMSNVENIKLVAERILSAPPVCMPSGREFETLAYIRRVGNCSSLNQLHKTVFVACNAKLDFADSRMQANCV